MLDLSIQDDFNEQYEVVQFLFDSPAYQVYRVQKDQEKYIFKVYQLDQLAINLNEQFVLQENLVALGVFQLENVLPYIQTRCFDGRLFCIYKDFEGAQLLSSCIPQQGFDVQTFLKIAIQIVQGLCQIHQAQIIYKAVTPNHILVNLSTHHIQYFDFLYAYTLQHKIVRLDKKDFVSDLLYYIAPEQIGRMNKIIDERADLYSLGMTFYHLLTGCVPFSNCNDHVDLIHHHMTSFPQTLDRLKPDIPKILAQIITKLYAKDAEDRYQSALGCLMDLKHCQHLLQQEKNPDFVLSCHDKPSFFKISSKFYGRENDLAVVQSVLARVFQGSGELLHVTGKAGMGKTALVNQLRSMHDDHNCLFIEGKFQASRCHMSYSALSMLSQNILIQFDLLPKEIQTKLAERLHSMLGSDLLFVLEFLPVLEQFVKTPLAQLELSEAEKTKRFYQAMRQFVAAMATSEYPLIIFFDDLQWADEYSLTLIKETLREKMSYVLFVISYRDDELNESHPVQRWLSSLPVSIGRITSIDLKPLTQEECYQFITDNVGCCDIEQNETVKNLFYQTSEGNPFSLKTQLYELHQHGYVDLRYHKTAGWQWYIKQLPSDGIDSIFKNINEYLYRKIEDLDVRGQQVLKVISCFSQTVQYCTLEILCQSLPEEMRHHIISVLKLLQKQGFISQTHNYFHFVHDRVQEVVIQFFRDKSRPSTMESKEKINITEPVQKTMDFLAVECRSTIHKKIGWALLKTHCSDAVAIVEHLNLACLAKRDDYREQLTQLNIQAALEMKAVFAYNKCVEYLEQADQCLDENHWTTQHDLSFQILHERAHVYFLLDQYERSEALITENMFYLRALEKAALLSLLVKIHTIQGRCETALHEGIEALSWLDINLPHDNFDAAVFKLLEQTEQLLESTLLTLSASEQNIVSAQSSNAITAEKSQFSSKEPGMIWHKKLSWLLNLPRIQDEQSQLISDLLLNLDPPAYLIRPKLYPIIVLKMMSITLQKGLTPSAAKTFTTYGFILGLLKGEHKKGYALGQVGVQIGKKFDNQAEVCKASCIISNILNHWVCPLRSAVVTNREGYQAGLHAGEWQFAAYIKTFMSALNLFYQGDNLETVLASAKETLLFCQEKKNRLFEDTIRGLLFILNNLLGNTETWDQYTDGQITEEKYLQSCHELQSEDFQLSIYYTLKLQVLYLYGRYKSALQYIQLAQSKLPAIVGHFPVAAHHFYSALTLLAGYDEASLEQRTEYLIQISRYQKQMQTWAENCPANFQHKRLLIQAERARVEGQIPWGEILEIYNDAFQGAQENDFVQDAALASELAARFLLSRNKQRMAHLYITDAYHWYDVWGTYRKEILLKQEFDSILPILSDLKSSPAHSAVPLYPVTPSAFSEEKTPPKTPEIKTFELSKSFLSEKISYLDLRSLIEGMQTFSTEVDFKKLLVKIMKIIAQNAGAQKAKLLLEENGELYVKATYIEGQSTQILKNVPLHQSVRCVHSVVQQVQQTKKMFLSNDISSEQIDIKSYLERHHIRSLLCLPIMMLNRLLGVLYLENNLVGQAFTSERVVFLQILSVFIALSLENAGRYQSVFELKTQYQQLFNYVPISLWHLDYSALKLKLDTLCQAENITCADAFGNYLREHQDFLLACTKLVTFKSVNVMTLQLFGYQDEKTLKKELSHILSVTSPEAFIRFVGGLYFHTLPVQVETKLFIKNEERTVLQEFMLVGEGKNNWENVIMALRDITALKQSQHLLEELIIERTRKLQESEQRFRMITELSPVGIIQSDQDNRPVVMNEKFCRLCGIDFQNEEAQQNWAVNWIKTIHPEDRTKVAQAWEHSLQTKQLFHVEHRFLLSERQINWVVVNGKPLLNAAGESEGWLATITDITVHKKLEEQVRKTLIEYIGKVCHEIRNPLNAILGNLDLLSLELEDYSDVVQKMKETLTEDQIKAMLLFYQNTQEKWQDMDIGAKHLASILENVLTLQRLTAEAEEIKSEPLVLKHVIEDVISIEKVSAGQKQLGFFLNGVPEKNLIVESDAKQLRRILVNLISNAIKYTERGQVSLNVVVKEKTDTQVVIHFEVCDTGIGLSKDQIEKVYHPFWRVPSLQQGTGIGLTLTEGLVKKMGGYMLPIKSRVGEGSTFGFSLPFKKVLSDEIKIDKKQKERRFLSYLSPPRMPLSDESNTIQSQLTSSPTIQKSLLHVETKRQFKCLVVDDSEINRKLLCRGLDKIGKQLIQENSKCAVTFEEAINGVDAFTKFFTAINDKRPYHIAFMDILMPRMNGLDATREIRAYEELHHIRPAVFIVGLSGNTLENDIQDAFNAGVNSYIAKPYSFDKLKAIIKERFLQTMEEELSPATPHLILNYMRSLNMKSRSEEKDMYQPKTTSPGICRL